MSEEWNALLPALPGAAPLEQRPGGLWMEAPGLDVLATAQWMVERGGRLSTITAQALEDGETRVIYHYVLDGEAVNLSVRTTGGKIPSITPITPSASWPEREIIDLFAVTFEGHPNPARLIRPAQLQPGYFREPGGAAGRAAREKK